MERIDVAEALALLERAVAEKGEDYIYPNGGRGDDFHSENGACVYQTRYTKQPACIVGHALYYKDLLQYVVDADYNEGTGPHTLAYALGVFTTAAADFLNEVQSAQDAGKTWGAALRLGRDFLAKQGASA